MNKRNPGGGDTTRKQLAKAKRARRKARLAAAVGARVKGLLLQFGTIRQELLNAQARIHELETAVPPSSMESAVDSAKRA